LEREKLRAPETGILVTHFPTVRPAGPPADGGTGR
jgi:hypothetical protein